MKLLCICRGVDAAIHVYGGDRSKSSGPWIISPFHLRNGRGAWAGDV